MEKKGLCETCSNDKNCDFPRVFPVHQCEELDDNKTKKKNIKKSKLKQTA
jgi:hypothetical protein